MSVRYRCVECGASVRLPDDRRGRKNYCPRCDARLSGPVESGGSGVVVALVLMLVFVGTVAIVGVGALLWFLGRDAAPVAQAPPPQVAAGPAEDGEGMRAGPPRIAPVERIEPPKFDPPVAKPDGEFGRPGVGVPEFVPPPLPPEFNRPPVRELKLPPLPAAVEIKPSPVATATDLKLPDTVQKAAAGGGGRFLVLHFPKLRKLGIFDANTAKVQTYINLPEDKIHFTAGMNKLLVFLPSAEMVRRYDLVTGKLEVSKPFKAKTVTAFVMGHSSSGPLVVRGDGGARLYDAETFAEIPLPDHRDDGGLRGRIEGPGGTPILPFDGGDVWPAGNGRVFGNTGNYGMPNGVKVVSIDGGKVSERREHVGTWFVQPSPDGKYVFSGGHKPVTIELKPSPDLVESGLQGSGHVSHMYLPAHHGPYYLGVGSEEESPQKGARRGGVGAKGVIRIYLYGLNQPVARVTVETANKVATGGADWALLNNLPTVIHLIPRANLLVIRGGDSLRLIPVDLEKELEKSGQDFLLVTSAPPASYKAGTEFRYAVKVRSKGGRVEFKLEAGPDGMKVATDGTVTWKVPADHKEQVTVILSLKDQGGKEAFHNFTLVPEGDAPAVKAPEVGPAEPLQPKPLPARGSVRVPPNPLRPALKAPALRDRKSIALPDAAERVMPAGGGRFLVCHFAKLRKVGVFDMNEMKIVRFINLAEDKPMLATAMTKLVVYLPGAKFLQRYDLLTGTREKQEVLQVPDIKALAVGSASAGPVVISTLNGGRLFDLDTVREMELPPDDAPERFPGERPPGPKRLPFRGEKLTAAANGRFFLGSGDHTSGAVALEGNNVKFLQGHGDGWVFTLPSADAKYIFRAGHGAVTADGQKTQDVVYSEPGGSGNAAYFFLPALDGPFYFHFHFGGFRGSDPRFQKDPPRGITVYMYGLDTPIARVLDLQDLRSWDSVNQAGLPFGEHVQLIPRANVLVTVPPSRDKLNVVPLDLNQALEETGIEFLLVTSSPPGTYCPGKEVRYPIRARSKAGGLKFTLESAPDGAAISPDGVLTWKVPAGFEDPDVSIIVGVKDAAGKEAFHSFRLAKSDVEEAYVPDPEPEPMKAAPKADSKPDGPRIAYRLPAPVKALEVTPPEIDGRTEVRTPDRFDRVLAAGDGRYIVLHAIDAGKAFLFDVTTGGVARTIELGPGRTVVAAGMSQLLVYRPSDNSIEKFALATGASEGKKSIPTRAVTEIVMGSASAGPLFVRAADRAELYDVESLTPMDLPKSEGFPFAQGPVWASADGRAFGNSLTRATGSFVRVAVLRSDSIQVKSELLAARYVVPGADGSNFYVAGYGELDARLQHSANHGRPIKEGSDPAMHLLPAPGGAYFLILHAGVGAPQYLRGLKESQNGVSIWHREQRRPIAALTRVDEVTEALRENPELPSLVHYHPEARVLVTVPTTRDRLVLYPVALDGGSYAKKKPIPWRLPDAPAPAEFKSGVVKERTMYEMPARILKVAAGGGGRYLVHQTDGHKLSVFDLNEAKIVREITTDNQIYSFAAGMAKLVLLELTSSGSILRRFDLATGKLESTVGPTANRQTLVLGSGSAGPVAAFGDSGDVVFYDLGTLAPMQLPDKALTGYKFHHDRGAASADGRTFLTQSYHASGTNSPVVMALHKDGVRVRTADSISMSSTELSADGSHVFIGSQGIYTSEFKKAADVIWSPDFAQNGHYGMFFAPAVDGQYYLQIHLGVLGKDEKFANDPQFGVSVFKYGQEKPLGRLPSVMGPMQVPDFLTRVRKPSHVFHFAPSAKLLVALDRAMTRLHLIPLDPDNIPVMPDPDPFPVRPKTPAKTTPKSRPAKGGPAPAKSGKPFRLAPLPEPLPLSAVTEANTAKIEIQNVAGSMSPVVVRLGGGGRFLLVQWHARTIDVFDSNEAKVVRRIELPTEFSTTWAAGMTKLVVSDQGLRKLYKFDLLTGKEELRKEYGEQCYVESMGWASDGPVLCHTTHGLRLVDLETLELMDLAGPDLTGWEYANKKYWASADGRAYGVSLNVISAGGTGASFATVSLRIGAEGATKSIGQFPSMYAVPDPTGRYLFAGGHGVYDLAFGKTKDAVRSEDPSRTEPFHVYLPALDGPFYMRYVPGGAPGARPVPAATDPGEVGVSIYAYGQSKPIARIKDVDLSDRRDERFSLPRVANHLFLIPRAKAMVVFNPREMTVRFIPVDLEAEMARSGVEVPWVTSQPPRSFKPGGEVTYPLKVASRAGGLKYALESPASGMAVSADGLFRWKAPTDAPMEVRVAIRVTDAKGAESVHSFALTRQ